VGNGEHGGEKFPTPVKKFPTLGKVWILKNLQSMAVFSLSEPPERSRMPARYRSSRRLWSAETQQRQGIRVFLGVGNSSRIGVKKKQDKPLWLTLLSP